MCEEKLPRVRILAVIELEADGDLIDPDRLFTAFQEEVEAAGAAYSVERARLSDLDDFMPDEAAVSPYADGLVPSLDVEPEDL